MHWRLLKIISFYFNVIQRFCLGEWLDHRSNWWVFREGNPPEYQQLLIRLWSHRSIQYTVFDIRYTIRFSPQTWFRSFHATSLECCLWRRANHVAYSEYRIYSILLCDHSLMDQRLWLTLLKNRREEKSMLSQVEISHKFSAIVLIC